MKRESDYYSRQAKSRGYPARSVFKLMEIQRKYRFIRPGRRILDLGAAPGSWSQYCLEIQKGRGRVVAVDRKELSLLAGSGFRFFKGDLFDPEMVARIAELGAFDLLLSDAAPDTSGTPAVDTQRSLEIARQAVRIAERCLEAGGDLVIKVFQGGEEGEVLKDLQKLFQRAKAFKPVSSRKESREVFFLGFGYKRPPS